MLPPLGRLVRLTRSTALMRRYFVVNGFDGALTMLGLTMGFRMSGASDPKLAVSACVGTAIALGMSGVSSAYVSETAERQRDLKSLEQAMIADLADTEHGAAARLIPVAVALVNGLAPLSISLLVIIPLWLDLWGLALPWAALDVTAVLAFLVVFLLGVLMGWISGRFWLWTGARAVLIAAVTAGLIVLFVR